MATTPSQLVRKLLRATGSSEEPTAEPLEPSKKKQKQPRKRKRIDETPATMDEIVHQHVLALSALDRTKRKKEGGPLRKKKEGRSKMKESAVVGIGRSSASQATIPQHIPTYNKRRAARQKKEAELKRIAKLLKKAK